MTEDMLTEGRRRAGGDDLRRPARLGGRATRWRCRSRTRRFDAYTISFGIRNVTRIEDALGRGLPGAAARRAAAGARVQPGAGGRRCGGSTTAIRSTSSRRWGRCWPGTGRATSTWSSRSGASRTRRPSPAMIRGGGLRAGRAVATCRWASPRCTRAGSSEGMRGPHNIWRLIRTGATFERTGAMRSALEALDAPPSLRVAARVLGWPFQWLGLEGDPAQPPILRALTALGPAYIKFGQLLSTRPDVVGPELAAELDRAAGQAAALPDRGGAGDGRARARAAGRRGLLDLRAAGGGGVAGAGAPGDAARDRAGGGGQGAAAGDRAGVPARRRRLLLRRRR